MLLTLLLALEVEIPFSCVCFLVVIHGRVVRASYSVCVLRASGKSVKIMSRFAFRWSERRLFWKLEAAAWQTGE